jgi:drug/metabolite transporter (DMT)-like permease
MKMKTVACLAFLLNAVLFGTYYAISKEVLGRIDPIVFTFFETIILLPAAIGILIFARRQITRSLIKRGVLLGSSLCLAIFTIAIALKYTTATGTAFFPSLNGFLAAFMAWIFLRHPIGKMTWVAGVISVAGTALLIFNSSMGGVRGTLIAFLGGLFFTGYVFLSDYEQEEEYSPWALFGVELLTTALWASLVVLLFGDWNAFHPALPKDGLVLLYVAGACTFLPTLIAVLMQKHVSPITVSFIYILEPIFGAIVAAFYLHEMLPLNGYLGGALVMVGALVHTWGSARQSNVEVRGSIGAVGMRGQVGALNMVPTVGKLGSPVLILVAGALLLYKLHGLPMSSWDELHALVLRWSSFQQQGLMSVALLMMARSLCWLAAWGILCAMVYRALCSAALALRHLPTAGSSTSSARLVASVPFDPITEERLELDVRMLRQMGVTPYALTSLKRKEAQQSREKLTVQRRRKDRRERLMSIERAD